MLNAKLAILAKKMRLIILQRPRGKKILIGLVAATILIVGIFKWRNQHQVPELPPVWVQTTLVTSGVLPLEVNSIGTLVAPSVEITPEVAGHVDKILFQDGSYVTKGTALIQLDDAVFKAQLESAKAKLSFSENNYHRMQLLGKQGAIAKQAIDQADADLKQRRAEAEQSKVMVEKMLLLAPFDGAVDKAKISPGDYVTIGQALVTLTDTKHLRVEYNVSDKFLSLIKIGQTVIIKTSAYPEKTFTGTVSFISPTINSENRSISLYATVLNETNLLAPGMFVNVSQSLGQEEKVLLIPARSLVPAIDGEQVYRVIDGKAYAVNIIIGKRTPESVQVLKGLAPGDVVVTDGQFKLKNGSPVSINANRITP